MYLNLPSLSSTSGRKKNSPEPKKGKKNKQRKIVRDPSPRRQRVVKKKQMKQGHSTDEEDLGSEYSECDSNDERSPKVLSVDSSDSVDFSDGSQKRPKHRNRM
jgi:hypothetical protein